MIMMKGLRYMNFEDLNIHQQYAFYRILGNISVGGEFVDICSENDEILDLFYNEILKKFSTVKELKLDDVNYNNENDLLKNRIKINEYIKECHERHVALIVRDAEKFFHRMVGKENNKFSLENYGVFHAMLREYVNRNTIIFLGKREEWILGGLMDPNARWFIQPYYLDDSEFLTRYGSLSESEAKEWVKRLSNCDFDEQRKVLIKNWFGDGEHYER